MNKKSVKSTVKKVKKLPSGFVLLKNLKKGTFFKTRNTESCPVLVKDEFIRIDGLNKYSCHYFNDVCRERFLKGDTPVFTDFIF